eukprot:m.23582 g.23582  ORF g.23582 m.23582 type:complete len:617 (+) comp5969_c0_seq2:188-2038(+)
MVANSKEVARPSRQRSGMTAESTARARELLRIMFPRWISGQGALLTAHSLILTTRSMLSLYVAHVNGMMVKAIIDQNANAFVWTIFRWLAIALPSTFVNSCIRFLEKRLALAFRSNLTAFFQEKYMADLAYYRVRFDSRIDVIDQRLTDDITQLSAQTAHLYNHVTKPCFDILLVVYSLIKFNLRAQSPSKQNRSLLTAVAPLLFGTGVVILSMSVLRLLSPRFGAEAAARSQAEGHYRTTHSRVLTSAEEIAFLRGEAVENAQLCAAYAEVARQERRSAWSRLYFVTIEQFVLKYVWNAAGSIMVALPQLHRVGTSVSERAMSYTETSKMLSDAADAVQRLLSAQKEVQELGGYVDRIHELGCVLDDMHAGTIVTNPSLTERRRNFSKCARLVPGQEAIFLEGATLTTPTGEVLTKPLHFRVEVGQHTLISGPNGSGKSTLLRVIAGLCSAAGPNGRIGQPASFMVAPQRAYLAAGSLRAQVLYPMATTAATKHGWGDTEVRTALQQAGLGAVVEREGGIHACREWADVLSGGERQQLAIARLALHRPTFALLDECTSAMTDENERRSFTLLRDLGITLFTVAHQPNLRLFHTHSLIFDGAGGCTHEANTARLAT